MCKQIYKKRFTVLLVAVFALTLIDATCTTIGVSAGVIAEGNPIFSSIMTSNPVVTSVAAVVYTSTLLAFVWRYGAQFRCTMPLMSFVVVVKVAVVGLHLAWMLSA